MREEPKILHYLDVPIQHASDEILRRMGRRTDRAHLEKVLGELREAMPDICIRTTLITGFPGETEEDHQQLMEFVRQQRFDRLGVFTCSKEEGTPAARMKGQIPQRTKKRRQKELMLLQQQIAFEKEASMHDRVLRVMIEGRIVGEDVYTARTYRDAPGVDGTVFVETEEELMTGDMPLVRITGAQGYDPIDELSAGETE
jgi:ribosomal protein S12 methylthiotransferase